MKWLPIFTLLFFWQYTNAQCDNYQYNYLIECGASDASALDTISLIVNGTHPFVISVNEAFYNNYEINNANQTFNYYYNIEDLIIETDFELIIYMPQFCIDTISEFAPCQVLAIELLSFNAANLHETNVINWQTASAVNEDFFILQSSENGLDFSDLVKIPIVNHTAGIKQYQYIDQSITNKKYYRLLSQDINGTKKIISPIKMVENPNYAQPSAVVNNRQITLSPSQSKWLLYNNHGLLIATTTNGIFDISQLPLGIYIVSTTGYSTKVANW